MPQKNCLKFIQDELPVKIFENEQFVGHKFLSWEVKESTNDFGFMSIIIDGHLKTVDSEKKEHELLLIIKIMQGSEDFRKNSQSYVQFQNEIFVYEKVLPFFRKCFSTKKINFNPEIWTPKTFVSIFLPHLDDISKCETVLVQENIKHSDFYTPESLYLTENHFNVMIDYLAQLHSVSLSLKITKDKEFESLVHQLTPLCFEDPSGQLCMFDILYDISTARLFKNIFENEKNLSKKVIEDVQQLRKKVGIKPVKLLDHFRKNTDFSVFVHGDFNRNNLMFKQKPDGYAMRMIDFQQVRYGSVCLDLAFFMYLNIDPADRPKLWQKLLLDYHCKFLSYTANILNIKISDSLLQPYNLTHFLDHCKKMFLFGLLITNSFTPWLIAPKEETAKVGKLFQANMFDAEYRAFAMVVGGEIADKRMIEDAQHASQMGYLDICYE